MNLPIIDQSIENAVHVIDSINAAANRLPLPKPTKQALRALGFALSLRNGDIWKILPQATALERFSRQLSGFLSGVLLSTAYKIELFDRFPENGGGIHALATRLRLNAGALEPFLNALTALGYLHKTDGTYNLTAFSSEFLRAGSPYSVAPMLRLLSQGWEAFAQLSETLKTGRSPKAMDIFNPKNPIGITFIHVVNAQLYVANKDAARRIGVKDVRRFIVGSAGVSFAKAVLDESPQSKVVFACLPHLVDQIPNLMNVYDIPRSRVESFHRHSGNAAKDTWDDTGKGYDLAFLTRKMSLKPLKDFGTRFLEKARESLKPGGRVVVWEPMLNSDRLSPRNSAVQAAMDLYFNQGGKTYTETDLRGFMQKAGFKDVRRVNALGGMVPYLVGTR